MESVGTKINKLPVTVFLFCREQNKPVGGFEIQLIKKRPPNRHRKKMRPAEPREINFNLDEDYIPVNFYRGDVKVENQRHMIFATDREIQVLHVSKTWFVDATFNVVKSPFSQLFNIHAFIKANGKLLMFILMSGKRKSDYKKVMKKVKNLLPPGPAVTRVVADFEAAMWKGILSTFPEVHIQGCLFHWAQALRRKMGELGILKSYKNNANVNALCRKLLDLPFLPMTLRGGIGA